jgi:hypothetical protein
MKSSQLVNINPSTMARTYFKFFIFLTDQLDNASQEAVGFPRDGCSRTFQEVLVRCLETLLDHGWHSAGNTSLLSPMKTSVVYSPSER